MQGSLGNSSGEVGGGGKSTLLPESKKKKVFLKVLNTISNIFVSFSYYGEFKTYIKVDRNNKRKNDPI